MAATDSNRTILAREINRLGSEDALQKAKEIMPQAESLFDQQIDVAAGQVRWFQVIAAEHASPGVAADERMQHLEIVRGTATACKGRRDLAIIG